MRRFIFSTKASGGTPDVLKGLYMGGLIQTINCDIVITEDDTVAELLAKLDTAEEIPVQEPAKPERKPRKARQSSSPLVECPVCHELRHVEYMTKAGPCKVCHMRELKADRNREASEAIQTGVVLHNLTHTADEPSLDETGLLTPIHTALPPAPQHTQENRAERMARPKDKINTANLSGRRVG